MSSDRRLSYSLAINEALHQSMAADKRVFLIGQGVKSPWYVGNTARGLLERFGAERVIDTPVSENAVTGAAVGAAIAGMRPVVVHPRMDFMVYALDPVINEAANWHYMSGGASAVPLVIWAIINRGGEQAAQHSQALHSIFCHVPGLKVVMPSCAYDAKGLMIAAIRDDNPVVFIDDRWLYAAEGKVPQEPYTVEIGKGAIRRRGADLTICAISYMAAEAVAAARVLSHGGIDAEVIDLRTAKPLDYGIISRSVRKTGRLLIADTGWKSFGFSAEVAAFAGEKLADHLKCGIRRIALPDVPAPSSAVLEKAYYPGRSEIIAAVRTMFKDRSRGGKI